MQKVVSEVFKGKKGLPRELIAAMMADGSENSNCVPQKSDQYMCTQQEWANHDGEQVGENEFNRMSVFRSHTNGCSKFVVNFVNVAVKSSHVLSSNRRRVSLNEKKEKKGFSQERGGCSRKELPRRLHTQRFEG
jgi:hypothetical protein